MTPRNSVWKQLPAAVAVVLLTMLPCTAAAQEVVADVEAKKYTLDQKELVYYVIGAADSARAPENGYKLLIVLPGGDGSVDFQPFVNRIYKHALSGDYLVLQLIAPQWSRRQKIVWPTAGNRVARMKATTEEFLMRAVADLQSRTRIDERHVVALGWSSGGPAVYAASLTENSPITGSFVAMSVFKPSLLPDLTAARGRAYYILHSPQDRVCPFFMARNADKQLRKHTAAVKLATYQGGHGWRGDVYGEIRAAMSWLEEQTVQETSNTEDHANR